tara:strand:+ start:335 stop:790 length:456 start_codon:yes stop_codon:yes gene_type:complete
MFSLFGRDTIRKNLIVRTGFEYIRLCYNNDELYGALTKADYFSLSILFERPLCKIKKTYVISLYYGLSRGFSYTRGFNQEEKVYENLRFGNHPLNIFDYLGGFTLGSGFETLGLRCDTPVNKQNQLFLELGLIWPWNRYNQRLTINVGYTF